MLLTIILIVTILGVLPISILFIKDMVISWEDTWKELKEDVENKLDY